MKKIGTQSNNLFYQKTQDILGLVALMQTKQHGVSLNDIMHRFNVSKRTAIRMKDMIKEQFPQLKEVSGPHNHKTWFIPQGNLSVDPVRLDKTSIVEEVKSETQPTRPRLFDVLRRPSGTQTTEDKIKQLFLLGQEAGYPKLTDKQLVIAYYGKYTTKDGNDRKGLSDIREVLSKLESPYKEMIDSNE